MNSGRVYLTVYPTDKDGKVDYSSPMLLFLPKGVANKLRDMIKSSRNTSNQEPAYKFLA